MTSPMPTGSGDNRPHSPAHGAKRLAQAMDAAAEAVAAIPKRLRRELGHLVTSPNQGARTRGIAVKTLVEIGLGLAPWFGPLEK